MSQQREIETIRSPEPRGRSPSAAEGRRHAAPIVEPRAIPARRGLESDPFGEIGQIDGLNVDAALLATANGDRSRFAALFQVIAPRAKDYLMGRGATPVVAENFAIAMMVEVWRTAGAFDPKVQSSYAWIYQRLRDVSAHHDACPAQVRS